MPKKPLDEVNICFNLDLYIEEEKWGKAIRKKLKHEISGNEIVQEIYDETDRRFSEWIQYQIMPIIEARHTH